MFDIESLELGLPCAVNDDQRNIKRLIAVLASSPTVLDLPRSQ
jgi:hypothetical protein